MIFDTHAHYDDEAFNEDRDELLTGLLEAGVEYVVNVGASIETTKQTIGLTEQYSFVYGAAGVHPNETGELNEENFAWLKSTTEKQKIVAVGEIGLDYYWDKPEHEIQKYWFDRQLAMAKEVKLPVIIHSRDAAKDTLDIMKAADAGSMSGVIHCFSYGIEMAREYLNMGFYLGIGGVVTFNNARKMKEVVEYMPLEQLLIETDCPYLSPVPNRGRRNSSENLPYVIKAIAEIKGISAQEVEETSYLNARKFYGI